MLTLLFHFTVALCDRRELHFFTLIDYESWEFPLKSVKLVRKEVDTDSYCTLLSCKDFILLPLSNLCSLNTIGTENALTWKVEHNLCGDNDICLRDTRFCFLCSWRGKIGSPLQQGNNWKAWGNEYCEGKSWYETFSLKRIFTLEAWFF